ncbi:glutaredoxin-3 [Rhizophagus diaphanus]|nr:glutaredoxin-3 [Rhizophagus diaphanus] [Rhizophagus sp. MUCL 43196]
MDSNLIELTSEDGLKNLIEKNKGSVIILDFWATWAQPCSQMNEVFAELAGKNSSVNFVKIEAEKFPELSESFEIEAVPAFIVLKNGKIAERINGANAPELTNAVAKYAKVSTFVTGKPVATSEKKAVDLNTRLKELTNSSPVMAFIKGTPTQPRCGFSRKLIEIFNENQVKFSSFNILADEEVRQGLKEYSNWPTYPQVYINGELVGGLDIIKELVANGEFKGMIPKEKDLNERLKELTTKGNAMIFIKGSPEAPRCGFSKTLVNMLDEKKIKYEYFDILQDEEVRQGLKKFVDWPTYPMVFNKGELVGGLDIIKELDSSGELDTMFALEKST